MPGSTRMPKTRFVVDRCFAEASSRFISPFFFHLYIHVNKNSSQFYFRLYQFSCLGKFLNLSLCPRLYIFLLSCISHSIFLMCNFVVSLKMAIFLCALLNLSHRTNINRNYHFNASNCRMHVYYLFFICFTVFYSFSSQKESRPQLLFFMSCFTLFIFLFSVTSLSSFYS
jgi:hypothetical protein